MNDIKIFSFPRDFFLLFIILLFMILILQFRPIDDFDIFHQIRLGQLTLEEKHLITNEPFTYTNYGKPIPVIGWVAQILFAVAFELGGWRTVIWLHIGLFAGAYFVAIWPSYRDKARDFSTACAILLGFYGGLTNSSVRPQDFAILSFAILLNIFRNSPLTGYKIFSLLLILVFWQNAHPSILIGFAIILPLVLIEWIRWLRNIRFSKPWRLTLILGLLFLVQMATPLGVGIFAISKTNLEISKDLFTVSEWLPPWDVSVRGAMVGFWFALALSFFLIFRLWKKIEIDDLSIFVVATLIALSSARFGIFWSIAMVPIWARWFEEMKPIDFIERKMNKLKSISKPGLAASSAALIVFLLPAILGYPAYSNEIPIQGIKKLREVLPVGNIYNYYAWGGPLVLEGSKDWRIRIDGRLYLYSREEWENYRNEACNKVPPDLLIENHRPDAFFLRRTLHQNLVNYLNSCSKYRKIYENAICTVFIRR